MQAFVVVGALQFGKVCLELIGYSNLMAQIPVSDDNSQKVRNWPLNNHHAAAPPLMDTFSQTGNNVLAGWLNYLN